MQIISLDGFSTSWSDEDLIPENGVNFFIEVDNGTFAQSAVRMGVSIKLMVSNFHSILIYEKLLHGIHTHYYF